MTTIESAVIELYTSGLGMPTIVKRLNGAVSKWHIRRILTANNIAIRSDYGTRGRAHNGDPQKEKEIVSLYKKGWGPTAISKKIGYMDYNIYTVLKRHGIPRREGPSKYKVGDTKSGKGERGYVREKVARDWPYLKEMGGEKASTWIFQHRKVMAESIGRALRSDEQVHHINGNKADNQIENLQLVRKHLAGAAHVCNVCGSHDISAIPLEQ